MGLRQLQRIFKDESAQTTPNAFIVAIKMEQAAHRLTAGDVSVAEVAYALGYRSRLLCPGVPEIFWL